LLGGFQEELRRIRAKECNIRRQFFTARRVRGYQYLGAMMRGFCRKRKDEWWGVVWIVTVKAFAELYRLMEGRPDWTGPAEDRYRFSQPASWFSVPCAAFRLQTAALI
jgi:hypothetical protein